jgi:hypothetical protein
VPPVSKTAVGGGVNSEARRARAEEGGVPGGERLPSLVFSGDRRTIHAAQAGEGVRVKRGGVPGR